MSLDALKKSKKSKPKKESLDVVDVALRQERRKIQYNLLHDERSEYHNENTPSLRSRVPHPERPPHPQPAASPQAYKPEFPLWFHVQSRT